MSLEQPDYTVVHREGDVEYRQYDSYLVSETLINDADDFKAAANEGFRRLFRYIAGGNESRSKIAMTAPVQQTRDQGSEKIAMTVPVQQASSDEGWRVAFMLPSKYTLETAPEPRDPRVQVREVPGGLVAALRFSGRYTGKNFAKKKRVLLASIEEQSVKPVGQLQSAMYSAPYMPPFLRRNEVLVEVDRLPATAQAQAPLRQAAAGH
ncbi:MAG: heme-binding protein [Gammaproteobacteria bacterium]|nr:heme-binding protein [Gammaproteobacteria bacterium]